VNKTAMACGGARHHLIEEAAVIAYAVITYSVIADSVITDSVITDSVITDSHPFSLGRVLRLFGRFSNLRLIVKAISASIVPGP
jgi:hypothetical protein